MSSTAAIYCHLPFCHTICPFCAFAVHGNRPALHAPYLAALGREVALCAGEVLPAGAEAGSVYFGGGTPSTISLEALTALTATLRTHFPWEAGAEIAFELNPEDTTSAYLTGLQRLGVNRVSLGLQSLDDPTLRGLGRRHDAAQGRRAVQTVCRAGPANFNLDLMLGAPGVGTQAFRADLEQVLRWSPPHLSVYVLEVEPGTRFGRDPAVQTWAEAHRDEQAEAFLWAAERLRGEGYRHYEVSNFCLPGHEGRQNELVWDGADYLGFGLGAHSYVAGVRRHNARNLRAYHRALAGGNLPVAFREELTAAQRANEHLLLALRRDTGLDPGQWARRHGFAWDAGRQALAARLEAGGQLRRVGPRLCLTDTGLLLADAITEQFMVA